VRGAPQIIDVLQRHMFMPLIGIIPPLKQVNSSAVGKFIDVDFLLGNRGIGT
jgi:hypothetical protein